jgi:transposase
MEELNPVFIGCDIGDKQSHLCVVDGRGHVTARARLRTSREAFEAWFGSCAKARVTLEVGVHSRWVSDLLRALGHEVVVANARNVQLITKSQRKTDRRDAELLARLGRYDPFLLGPVKHRGQRAHADLAVIKARDALVTVRTRLVNHARGLVKPFGGRLPKCTAETFARKAREAVPPELEPALAPIFECLQEIQRRIFAFEQLIEKMAKEQYPETARLRQVDRVGPITSLAFVLTLEDPARFPKSRTVGAYLGLAAGSHQSGDSDPEKRITKAGDPLLRRMLVQCAQQVLVFGRDSDLRRWGLALAARGKKAARKRAVVALARKLATLLHHLWATGAVYDPFHTSRLNAAAA